MVKALFPSSQSRRALFLYTGWLLDSRTVVTVAQAVYRPHEGFADAVQVLNPGGGTIQGSHIAMQWGWYKSSEAMDDLALIRLDDDFPSARPLEYRFLQKCVSGSLSVTMRRFFAKPHPRGRSVGLYQSSGTISTSLEVTWGVIHHSMTTDPGKPYSD